MGKGGGDIPFPQAHCAFLCDLIGALPLKIKGPAAPAQIKIGAKELGGGIARWERHRPSHFKWESGWPSLFFCFRSEGGLGAPGSSPAQPFCPGLLKLKPNAGKDSPTSHSGGGARFSMEWVLMPVVL
jgi:hypothetical protein